MQSNIESIVDYWIFFQLIFGGVFMMLIAWQTLTVLNLQKAAKVSRIKAPLIWQVLSIFNLILLISATIALFLVAR